MKATRLNVALMFLSMLVAVGRLKVPGHGLSLAGTYEAFAHIFVGFLIAVAILRWREAEGKPALVMLALLTALEVAAFMMRQT